MTHYKHKLNFHSFLSFFLSSFLSVLNDRNCRLYNIEWQGNLWIMNWKGCGRKQMMSNFRYYPSICLEGLTKTIKNINHDSLCHDHVPQSLKCNLKHQNPGPVFQLNTLQSNYCSYYSWQTHFISFYSFSINPTGSTNSCGCGNRPSLQYNKNTHTAQHTTTQNRTWNTIPVCKNIIIVIKLSPSVWINGKLYIILNTMSVIKSNSYKNSLQHYEP
jgi:hypothetical protein